MCIHRSPVQWSYLKCTMATRNQQRCTVVMFKEHPVSGGGGVSGSRFNVRDGSVRVNPNPNPF